MLIDGSMLTAALGCCLLGLDLMLFASFYTKSLDWSFASGGHLALGLVTALPGFGRGRGGAVWTARWQLAAWLLLLGPFGVLIGMTLFLSRADASARPASPPQSLPDDDAEPAPDRLDTLRNDLADGRLRLGGGHLIRPLLDVLIEGNISERLEALGLIAKRYVPGFAPALRRAFQDGDSSVRVLAATVMAQLNNAYTTRIGALQEAAQATPLPETWRALGDARIAYADSGLLESDRAKREADEGRRCLARAHLPGCGYSLDQVLAAQEGSTTLTAVRLVG